MKVNLNNTDNNDYVRGYKDGKKAALNQTHMSNKLPAEVQERIKQEAEYNSGYNEKRGDGGLVNKGRYYGYIAGATAWAERAQKLVDALEWIKTYGPIDELTVKFIDNALQQWKDQKEVGDEP